MAFSENVGNRFFGRNLCPLVWGMRHKGAITHLDDHGGKAKIRSWRKSVLGGNGFIKYSQNHDSKIMLYDEKIRNALQMSCRDDIVIVVFV